MPRSVAINVGANTTLPGFRAPIFPDGSFEYVPIPEREPTDGAVPTYGDLAPSLSVAVPADLADRRVHLDPEFPGYPGGSAYTYGDEHGVKAGPISELAAGDHLLFYATLEPGLRDALVPSAGGPAPDPGDLPPWVAPDWGAYLIAAFELATDPVTGEEYERRREDGRGAGDDRQAENGIRVENGGRDGTGSQAESDLARFANNAHVKRSAFDARVLVAGDPDGSRLFDRAVALSSRSAGADPNRIVTDLSADSGRGPWWRRPLRFDPDATAELLDVVSSQQC